MANCSRDSMKAAVLVEPGRFEMQSLVKPIPAIDEVVVKVNRCGICGTDIHIFNGHYSADKLPLVPGHEIGGVLSAIGSNVNHLKEGQAVTVDINHGCGYCYFCRKNEVLNCPQMNQIGITKAGGFAEYVCVPANSVVPMPHGVSFDELSLVEPVACVVRSAKKYRVRFGDSVAIIGGGPIGNLHTQMMRLIGAAPILVLERSSTRAEKIMQVGADAVADSESEMLHLVQKYTEGRGADHAIESIGHEETYDLATQLVRSGGQVCAFGLASPKETLCLSLLDTVLEENSIKGSVAGMGQDMFDAVHLMANKRFNLADFMKQDYPLEQIQKAFLEFNQNDNLLKVSIKI